MFLSHPWVPWAAFTVFILLLLFADLYLFHRDSHKISVKEAALLSTVWISLGVAFGIGVWLVQGPQQGADYFTGFLIEKSLSVDNIFVFVMVFSFFHVKQKFQHKILFYGILCAIILRALAIFAGVALLQRFEWLIYVFGGFLIVTGAKMLLLAGKEKSPEENPILGFIVRHFKMKPDYNTDKFFVRENGKLLFTPVFLALLAIEFSDIIFALDSVPAIFAVTQDPFIIYTSNVFAILGLRSLYFLSAELMTRLRYLVHGVAVVLLFVGTKMMASSFFHIPSLVSLAIVAFILLCSIAVSMAHAKKTNVKAH